MWRATEGIAIHCERVHRLSATVGNAMSPFRLALIVFLLLALAPAAQASAQTPVMAPWCASQHGMAAYLCVAYAQDPDAPCAGRVRVVFSETLHNVDAGAEATGRIMNGDQEHPAPANQPDVLVSCDITVRASTWRISPRDQRCATIAHEVEHLAGHRHYEGSAMTGRTFLPCVKFAALADRAIGWFMARSGVTNVECSTGVRVVRCDVEYGHHSRTYRVTARATHLIVRRIVRPA